MDRAIVYLFELGDWLYGVDYNSSVHSIKGKYVEVIIGKGWSSREVSDMLKAYYEENYDNLF